MRTFMKSSKEKGVVLLLILGFMSMFAIMVLTFIMMTTNMSESANSNDSEEDATEQTKLSPSEEVTQAFKTIMIGSNAKKNPIGPFSILENLYGHYDDFFLASQDLNYGVSGHTLEFDLKYENVSFSPTLCALVVTPPNHVNTFNSSSVNLTITVDDDALTAQKKATLIRSYFRNLHDRCGSVVTFGELNLLDFIPSGDAISADLETLLVNLQDEWNRTVSGSSTRILRKEFDARNVTIGAETFENEYCVLYLQRNDRMKTFFDYLLELQNDTSINFDFTQLLARTTVDTGWYVAARVNLSEFSGTGAGGFSPQSALDGQMNRGETGAFRLPFSLWANAAAPDLTPFDSKGEWYNESLSSDTKLYKLDDEQYSENVQWDFRTFWKHLADADYQPFTYYYRDNILSYPYYAQKDLETQYPSDETTAMNGRWIVNDFKDGDATNETDRIFKSETSAIRMNPGYTAPDNRTLFLAHYKKTPTDENVNPIKNVNPSFHRPEQIGQFCSQMSSVTTDVDWLSVLRKMTPRPLPLDHWNFDGGNDSFSPSEVNWRDLLSTDSASTVRQNMNEKVEELATKLAGQAEASWDVDNDGDRVPDGIWVPSGLPIRTSADGTPYATLYSFTILDMDGRINVNTAGSWDQLRSVHNFNEFIYGSYTNDLGQQLNDFFDPYGSVEDLANQMMQEDFPTNLDITSPWFDTENLGEWTDDLDRNLISPTDADNPGRKLIRGSGFGAANLNLPVALKKVNLPGQAEVDTEELVKNFVNPLLGEVLPSYTIFLERAEVLFDSTRPENEKFLAEYQQFLVDRDDTEENRFNFYIKKLAGQNAGENGRRAVINLFWNRYRTASEPSLLTDTNADTEFRLDRRSQLPQPGIYSDTVAQTIDDSDDHRLFYNFTDGVYDGDLTLTNPAEVENFIFPWRGKTRVSKYNLCAARYPTFDFNGSGLRSYDPLGFDIYTFAPKQNENPYLANSLISSDKDTPYQISRLEALLRINDYDADLLDMSLVGDLTDSVVLNAPDNADDIQLGELIKTPKLFDTARLNLTTISSDIPLPSSVFPLGPESDGDGVTGIYDLIRRCVIMEFYKRNLPTDENQLDPENPNYVEPSIVQAALVAAETDAEKILRTQYGLAVDVEIPTELQDELRRTRRALFTAILYDDEGDYFADKIAALTGDYAMTLTTEQLNLFYEKINALTDEIFSLLPEEIRCGRRLDLNDLSHKACWLDLTYNTNGEPAIPATTDKAAIHRHGLVERMKFVRGLYMLMSVLTWYERNAETVAAFYLSGESLAATFADYVEGSDAQTIKTICDDESVPAAERKEKAEKYRDELFAHRLAQWCVNVVDFTDPDVTMTPFYYDPYPFDGWWSLDESRMTDSTVKTWDSVFTAQDSNANFYGDIYDAFELVLDTPDQNASDSMFVNSIDADYLEQSSSYALNLAHWLEGKDATGTGGHDFGFRRVWGMERPDLLLTETLAFHDLGIADTVYEKPSDGEKINSAAPSEGDAHFDQVRRPQGSAYLELYCAANPNIPQSTELYEYDSDKKLWKLDLSRMTPRSGSASGSPYDDKPFPVWRIAISASCAVRDEDSEGTHNRKIRKKANSVLERLIGSEGDFATFSLQTRQFNGQKAVDIGADEAANLQVDSAWSDLDICVSNILGPVFSQDGSYNADLSKEVEIDRIVWLTRPLKDDSVNWESLADYPDPARLFWRIFEKCELPDDVNADKSSYVKSYLFPNQYLTIGPEDDRAIGSIRRNATNGLGLSPAPAVGYFGIPSHNRITMAHHVKDGNDVTEIVNVLNPVNGTRMCVRTYMGLDSGGDLGPERGLNISEPLWTAGADPFLDATKYPNTKSPGPMLSIEIVTLGEENYKATKEFQSGDDTTTVPDVPYDLPSGWGSDVTKSSVTKESPIAEDKLFGLGTVPGYRSAFVQRVTDPNRPYHPLLNPYMTMDWNMMDLTVFNGEAVEISGSENSVPFVANTTITQDYIGGTNKFVNLSSTLFTNSLGYDEEDTTGARTIFSSRQWLNPEQKMFYPQALQNLNNRPNPWARPVNLSAAATNAGLETAQALDALRKYSATDEKMLLLDAPDRSQTTERDALVIPFAPKHTLGWYNDRGTGVDYADGDETLLTADPPEEIEWYNQLETKWFLPYRTSGYNAANDSVYVGSPKASAAETDGTYAAAPFEYLIWNDAPLSNPAELMLVPASDPARFGLEFIRNFGGNLAANPSAPAGTPPALDTSNLYVRNAEDGRLGVPAADTKKQIYGRSFGSSSYDGTNKKNLFGYYFEKASGGTSSSTAAISGDYFFGPYLNFFSSSDNAIHKDAATAQWQTELGQSLNLAKIFEYVHLPSPYVGTQSAILEWNNASQQFEQSWETYSTDRQDRALYASKLREPGKVNLNTLHEPSWVGLLDEDASVTAYDDETDGGFVQGRRQNVSTENPADPDNPIVDIQDFVPFGSMSSASLAPSFAAADRPVGDSSLFARKLLNDAVGTAPEPLLNAPTVSPRGNLHAATEEIQKLSGTTTNRSNVFAIWLTVGYFEVEKALPGINMPAFDPDGNANVYDTNFHLPIFINTLTGVESSDVVNVDANGTPLNANDEPLAGLELKVFSNRYKYGEYYKAIYPDGYTYGRELGTGNIFSGSLTRYRGFYMIDRSLPVDFRRGKSWNWQNAVLLERLL